MHRTYLYTPGDRPDRMAKALGSGADALILDLEDGVAPSAKPDARREVAAFLAASGPGGPSLLVRLDPHAMHDDLSSLGPVMDRVDALYLAKASLGLLEELDELLDDDATSVVALVETAQGLLDAPLLARHPRVRNLAVGEADLTAELGLLPSGDARELVPLRMGLVVASAAAGIDPPTGPVSTDFGDLAAFAASTLALRRMGFGARSCIHPAQVPVAAEVLTPGRDEVERARALVTAFEDAVARGEGVFVGPDGRMVDEAVVRQARRLLS